MMAQATWGIGGAGAWSFTVSAATFDFAVLVMEKLVESDFDFVDIFEREIEKNGFKSESKINVYELYISWMNELWQDGKYFQAGVGFLGATCGKCV